MTSNNNVNDGKKVRTEQPAARKVVACNNGPEPDETKRNPTMDSIHLCTASETTEDRSLSLDKHHQDNGNGSISYYINWFTCASVGQSSKGPAGGSGEGGLPMFHRVHGTCDMGAVEST